MAMENRLATRASGDFNLPRVGNVSNDNESDNEKIYYGFGVFMGLPLADLKAMKDDFVEQQALTGNPPRHGLLSSTVTKLSTHCIEDEENEHDYQGDVSMATFHAQPQHLNGYEQQHDESQQREYTGEQAARYVQGPRDDEKGRENEDADTNSDGSDDYGNKSHSLNFILH
ncbi:unnamed protein product [Peronospora belbahrii]|uniref:Uncharacterized protein n=1 Tax=Peronospora belbahrii TaxID=622444 RepID=A0ABN8D8B3_9STRA|nr:unnamed protein product [Peronospora belbahrii]